jgi:hypothetical protein
MLSVGHDWGVELKKKPDAQRRPLEGCHRAGGI